MAIGFKHGSSGGDPLNFTVVNKSSEPTDPKENTIWITTTWAQNGWTFGADMPLRRTKSSNKNFVVYPYAIGTTTGSGVTLTDLGDGNFTVNGTATSGRYFRLITGTADGGMFLLPAGTYTLSGCPSGGSSSTYMVQLVTMDSNLDTASTFEDYGSGKTFTLDKDTLCRMNFYVLKGATFNNANLYLQVEKGSSATSFKAGNANGQVWIKPNDAGTISFEALKRDNRIVLHPGEVYMYNQSGGWNRQKTVKVYQNGEWKDLEDPSAPETPDSPWDGYYFNNGNQYEGVTGGWGAWSSGATIGDTIAVTNAGASTNNKVDLTNVSKLWFDSPSGSGAFGNLGVLCVTSEKNAASNNIKASVQVRAGRGSLDVSGLTGTYYISLYAGSQGYADVSAIWKE